MLDSFDVFECFKTEIRKIRDTANNQYEKDCEDLKKNSQLAEYVEYAQYIRDLVVYNKSIAEFNDFSDHFLKSIHNKKLFDEISTIIRKTKAKLPCCTDNIETSKMIDKFIIECGDLLIEYLGPY